MSRKGFLLAGIIVTSTTAGLLIAYLTRETTLSSEPFVAMATVQGAFVGIVFSIFVLASQVSATQFTPLTLEQLSKSRGFAALLGFYVFSILTNIYLLQTQSLPTSVPYLPPNWNLPLGLGAGLMTASLLSLLIARQLLAELTTPEHLLERTAKSASRDSFSESNLKKQSQPKPPTRTSLFTIERILIAAHKDDDEYTTQQAIYQLWKATDRLLTPSGIIGTKYFSPDPASYTEDLDVEKVLDYWTTAAKYGTKGPLTRVQQTATAHRHILSALVTIDEVPKAIEQLEYMCELSVAALEFDNHQSVVSEYEELAGEIASHESSALLTVIIRHHAQFVKLQTEQLEAMEDPELGDAANTHLSAIICNHITFLEQVWEAELTSSASRNRSESIISQLDTNLARIFDTFDEQPNPGPRKQTLLTDLHRRSIDAVSSIDTKNNQPTDRYIVIIAELSIALDRNPNAVAESLHKSLDENDIRREVLNKRLRDWPSEDSYRVELKPLTIDQEDVSDFVRSLAMEMSQL